MSKETNFQPKILTLCYKVAEHENVVWVCDGAANVGQMMMPRPRTIHLIQVIEERGIYGKCSCGGDLLFYSDQGIRCKECGKLYAFWYDSLNDSLKRRLSSARKQNCSRSNGMEK